MMFLGYGVLWFEDIENRRFWKDAPCRATYFTYQTLNTRINICGLTVMVSLKHRRFLDGVRPWPRRPIKPAGSKTGTIAKTKRASLHDRPA
jgi:hypothetical protein